MKVSYTSSSLVTPAKTTWNGRMPLADWDQIGYISHVPTIHIYKPPYNYDPQQDKPFVDNLRDSLSRLLVHFYPLAGRLRWIEGGRLELDCNSMGVQFIVAGTKTKLDDLGEFLTSPEIQSLAPHIDYEITPLKEHPLMYVQITQFQCGSISISPAISHVVVDGRTASYFLSEWSRLARGLSLEFPPFLDKRVLRAGEQLIRPPPPDFLPFLIPPLLIGKNSDKEEREKETIVSMLKLSKNQVEILKNKANETRQDKYSRPYSRYETITGHIWRCASEARDHKLEQPTGLGISVDIRRRMQPPIPQNFLGNSTIDVVASACSGDLISRPIGYSASRVREAIDKVTNEFVHTTIDFWKNQEDLTPFQDIHSSTSDEGPFYGNPNLGVTSWLTLPFQGLDFGWGEEVYMGPVTHDVDGDFILFNDNHNGDGSVIVRACLQVPHMKAFRKLFYALIMV
ncbi:acetyltransferase [Lithospermum erythrorhizon]|uniref:Acetyltransferase n=1 Tax=Lithospermum erythrorhizon TaxID=34254 RepID=A0AAV3RFH2_LITER